MIAIEQKHLVTPVAATGICNLMELEKLVQPQSRMAGKIRKIHEGITEIAAMVGGRLDAQWVDVGVNASNAGMKIIGKAIRAEGKRQAVQP